jgi:hypothetical protein
LILKKVMSLWAKTNSVLAKPDRRSFLWSLVSFGLVPKLGKSKTSPETVYRFLTPECEVRMSVEYYRSLLTSGLRFRDRLADRKFCLSANGEEGRSCLERFSGSMAIAHYHFHSRGSSRVLNVRERVLTIDHDSRLNPRPPYERTLPMQGGVVSDIQAFGYERDDPEQPESGGRPTIWCLLRQDLYFDDQATAFLIVHWKHTANFISLVDVIPGDQTQLIAQ